MLDHQTALVPFSSLKWSQDKKDVSLSPSPCYQKNIWGFSVGSNRAEQPSMTWFSFKRQCLMRNQDVWLLILSHNDSTRGSAHRRVLVTVKLWKQDQGVYYILLMFKVKEACRCLEHSLSRCSKGFQRGCFAPASQPVHGKHLRSSSRSLWVPHPALW